MKTSTLLLLFACAASVRAKVKLPALFSSDHGGTQQSSQEPLRGNKGKGKAKGRKNAEPGDKEQP